MALVKFYRGAYNKYNADTHKDGVYFAEDKQIIKMNGVEYGGVNMHAFEGFIKDVDVDGQTLTFKKDVIGTDGTPKWEDVSIQLIAAADNSIELGTITKGGVNDGSTIKVKLADHTEEDGLVVKADEDSKQGGLYVDLTKTNAAIKANKDAIEAMDLTDTLTAGSFVTKVDQADGKITVSKAAIASADKTITITADATSGAIDLKANIDGTTIIADKDEGTLSVGSSVLTQYVGENAISVSAVDKEKNTKTISLVINNNDKVLTQDANGLIANISMSYDETNRYINLTGKKYTEEGTEKAYSLGSIDASKFIKDGMLAGEEVFVADAETKSVTIKEQTHEFTGLTIGKHYIVFMFSTYDGTTKETEYSWDILDATSIIDVYKAGNGLELGEDKHTFSVKKDTTSADSEDFLSVSENGVKVSGVQDAIDAAKKEAKSVVAVKENEAHLELTTTTDDTDKHVTYTLNTTDVASDAELTKVETAVGLNEDGTHVATEGNYTKDATTVVGEIAALDTQVKKNADDIDALKKAEVSVVASTEEESTKYLEVTSTTDETTKATTYTVKAKGIDSAIDTAIKALDVDEVGTEGKFIQSIKEVDGKISATAIDLTATNVAFTAIKDVTDKFNVDATNVQDAIAALSKATYDALSWIEVE